MAMLAAFSAQGAEPVDDIVGPVVDPQTVASPDTPPPIAATATPLVTANPQLVAPSTSWAPAPTAATVTVATPPAAAPPPADLPSPAAYQPWTLPELDQRWRGFYGGLNLGYGWIAGTSGSNCTNTVTDSQSGCTLIPETGPNPSGPVGGGQVGYMAPIYPGPFMLMVGGEFDVEGTGLSGTQSIAPPIPLSGFSPCTTCSFFAKESLSWLASLRARVGVPVGRVLVYGTGGVMFGSANVSQSISFTNTDAGSYQAAAKQDLVGPTVGGGVEFLADGPWSVRLEGLYYDLGSIRTVAQPTGTAFVNFNNEKTFGFRGGIIRLAVNFHLGDFGDQ
ncbi:MAG TPA: outer membrane beta-barrel protein [Stellaceae bacterium]|nr:outer membrane beta-barrel protein [Stellaceae bacterium]